MGTVVEVISPDKRAADIAFKEIKRVENLLSLYKDDSEISQLNTRGKLKVSPETLFVIKKAREFWEATEGGFDVSVAPLLELWGFYNKNYRVPDDSKVEDVLNLIGFDKLNLSGNIVEFKVKGMKIDLGAIAKGFAVDCAVKRLRLAGINSALVNAGGDIYCLGGKREKSWRIAVRAADKQGFAGYLELRDKAVATSGDYEQYFIADGARFCHIINPKTGKPAVSGVIGVSVIADDCLTADALATSIFVLGADKGRGLVERFNAEVRIIEAD